MVRLPVYNEHPLVKGQGRRTRVGSKGASEECERRNRTRQLCQRLSTYYRLEERRAT
jgi:hypothetical protein